MSKQRTVVITFDHQRRPVPLSEDGKTMDPIAKVRNGDELNFFSPHGPVQVRFDDPKGSPLEGKRNGGITPHPIVATEGLFQYHCGITIDSENGKSIVIGWPDQPTLAGGTVEVVK